MQKLRYEIWEVDERGELVAKRTAFASVRAAQDYVRVSKEALQVVDAAERRSRPSWPGHGSDAPRSSWPELPAVEPGTRPSGIVRRSRRAPKKRISHADLAPDSSRRPGRSSPRPPASWPARGSGPPTASGPPPAIQSVDAEAVLRRDRLRALMNRGRHEEALQELAKIQPHDEEMDLYRAFAISQEAGTGLDEVELADLAAKAMAKNRLLGFAYYVLGRLAEDQGRPRDAARHYRKAVQVAPELRDARRRERKIG